MPRFHEALKTKVLGNILNPWKALTEAVTLNNSETGKCFSLDSSGGAYTITLPTTLKAGTHYRFRTKEDTPTGDITIAMGSAIGYGVLFQQADTDEDNLIACAGVSNVLVEAASLKGDWLDFLCDGTNWYISGGTQVQAGFSVS